MQMASRLSFLALLYMTQHLSALPRVQVERQIDQMVRFIKQEAEEKANEISVSAEEVCSFCS